MNWIRRVYSKIKERWGIESDWQFWKIMLVFALTGMSAVQIRKLIFPLIGINTLTPWYITVPVWIAMITPFYYIFLTIYAWIFRETKFFGAMMKKSFSRFRRKRKEEIVSETVEVEENK